MTVTQLGGGRTADVEALSVRPAMALTCGGNPVTRAGLPFNRCIIGWFHVMRMAPGDSINKRFSSDRATGNLALRPDGQRV